MLDLTPKLRKDNDSTVTLNSDAGPTCRYRAIAPTTGLNKATPQKMTQIIRLDDHAPASRASHRRIYFSRPELMRLLGLYSQRVARGEWRDYAIDHQPSMALFSIFRSSFERPVYIIAKAVGQPRQGPFTLFEGRHKLKQARDLGDIITYLENRLSIVGR